MIFQNPENLAKALAAQAKINEFLKMYVSCEEYAEEFGNNVLQVLDVQNQDYTTAHDIMGKAGLVCIVRSEVEGDAAQGDSAIDAVFAKLKQYRDAIDTFEKVIVEEQVAVNAKKKTSLRV